MQTFLLGFGFGLSLITAIGPQNAFVIKQGLKGNHVLLTTTFCILCDAVLMSIGAMYISKVISLSVTFQTISVYCAIILLCFYSIISFRSAFSVDTKLLKATIKQESKLKTILICAGFSLLNPHVYIDTVILVGAMASKLAVELRPFFALGSITASITWFYLIGFGAKSLSGLAHTPRTWMIINLAVGVLMFYSAVTLTRIL